MGLRYTCAAPPLCPSEPAGRDRSFVQRALVCRRVLSVAEQKAPVYHHPQQALWVAAITLVVQPVPQFHHTQIGLTEARILNKLLFFLCMLFGMAVRTSRLTAQRLFCFIPARLPKADIRPDLVVFLVSTDDAVFFCIFHEKLPICHVLCDILAHEGYGSFLVM